MQKLKLVESHHEEQHLNKLHPEITNILFENHRFIKNVFNNINGLYELSYMGITFIDPSNQLITFSTTPSLEFNLINQNLWLNDPCFAPHHHKNTILWWSCDNKKIEKIKFLNNNFVIGFSISRVLEGFCLIYSFASRASDVNLKNYYQNHKYKIIDIGDYFYKSVKNIYAMYNNIHIPPQLSSLNSKSSGLDMKPKLRLINCRNSYDTK